MTLRHVPRSKPIDGRPRSPVLHTSRLVVWLLAFGLFIGCGQPSDRPSMRQTARVEHTEKPAPVEVAYTAPPLISAKDTGNVFEAENPPTHDAGANVGKAPWNDCERRSGGMESPEALMRRLLTHSDEPLDEYRLDIESLMPDACTYFAAMIEFDDIRRADILMMKADSREGSELAKGVAAAEALRAERVDFAATPIERVAAPWCEASDEKRDVPCITWTRIRTPGTTLQMQAVLFQDRWYPLTPLVVPMPIEAVESWLEEHAEAVGASKSSAVATRIRAEDSWLPRVAVEQIRLEAQLVIMSPDEVARVAERVSKNGDFIRKFEAAARSTAAVDTPETFVLRPGAIEKTAHLTYAIDSTRFDRDEVRRAFQAQVRVAPHFIGDDFKGMQLGVMLNGSIGRALGLRGADIITDINGVATTSIDLEKVWTLLFTPGEHRITIERHGVPRELVWTTK